jgi:hypothetical protein
MDHNDNDDHSYNDLNTYYNHDSSNNYRDATCDHHSPIDDNTTCNHHHTAHSHNNRDHGLWENLLRRCIERQ